MACLCVGGKIVVMVEVTPKAKKLLVSTGKVLGCLVVIGLLAWVLVINPYLTRKEKQRFEAAATSLQTLADQIQASIGKAGDVKLEKSCDRANMKSNSSQLVCDRVIKLTNANQTPILATKPMEMVSRSFGSKLMRMTYFGVNSSDDDPAVFTTRENGNTGQAYAQKIQSFNDLSCSLNYGHDYRLNSGTFDINTVCTSPARAEHYPLKD